MTDPVLMISLFTSETDNRPKMEFVSWIELCRRLMAHQRRPRKEGGPCWSPTYYPPGAPRLKANVIQLTCLVLEVDDGTGPEAFEPDWGEFRYVLHSTFSHTGEKPRWRAVFPLAQSVWAEAWEEVWRRLTEALAKGRADPQCKDPSRLYFLPSCPPGDRERFARAHAGRRLSASDFPSHVSPLPVPSAPSTGNRPGTIRGSARVSQKRLVEQALATIVHAPHPLHGQGRHAGTRWVLTQLRDNGYDEEEARALLDATWLPALPATDTKGAKNAFTPEEAYRLVLWVYGQEAREPWPVPDRAPDPPEELAPPERKANWNGSLPLAEERPPREARDEAEVAYRLPAAPIHNTDLGNARRLVRRDGNDLRYAFGLGWFVWGPGYWEQDETGEAVRRAKETVGQIYSEAATAPPSERQTVAKWGLASESEAKLSAMLELAKTEPGVCVRVTEFDRDPMVFTSKACAIVLAEGTSREPRREDLCSRSSPVAYDERAACPRWENFLLEVLGDDALRVGFVQRAVGYSLTGDVREQCLFFLTGTGSNGKSTFLSVLSAMMGGYGCMAAPGLLLEHKTDQHPTALADLFGKRLVTCVEVGEGRRLAEELVKQLTGGDAIKGRRMRQDFFEFQPQFKIWLAANHKPNVRGTDEAIWRRIHTIPFDVTFVDAAVAKDGDRVKDPGLKEALTGELPGILAWAVRGCLEWQRIGLKPPSSVRAATLAYREEMDVLGAFLKDRCTLDPEVLCPSGALYAAYQEWCQMGGERAVTQTRFGRALSERGFEEVRKRPAGRVRQGIGLALDSPECLPPPPNAV